MHVTTGNTNLSTSPQSMVELHQLDFAYSDRLVLKQINLDIPTGAATGLVGPNGGGKTTLIRVLLGLLRPTRGEVRVAGMPPGLAAKQGGVIGYLPQIPQINTSMPISVRQVLELSGQQRPHPEQVNDLLKLVGLHDLADVAIGELSGGQLQRMLIARALAVQPRLLILDEPTTGIDVSSRKQFVELIRTIRAQQKLTLLIASHDLHVLNELCEDIACLNVTLHLHHRRSGEPMPPDEVICSLTPTPLKQ